jgi:redox-sensitive bicupin YhaK (pirin superfamily)
MVVLDREGGPVLLAADADGEGAEVLLAAGEPIGEPVARYGPFVMNSEREIVEAIADFRAGRMGEIAAEHDVPGR